MSTDTLGQLIALRRKAKGLTQTQLASRLGVDQSRISQYERGEKVPSKYMRELSQILEIHPQHLIAHVFELFNDTEQAIVNDPELSRKEQDLMLTIYGHLRDRDSMTNASLFRSIADDWDKHQTAGGA